LIPQPRAIATGGFIDPAAGIRRLNTMDAGGEGCCPAKETDVKDEKREALKENGMSTKRAAEIANSPGLSNEGGHHSHSRSSHRDSRQRDSRHRGAETDSI
jgi:hypothetical protein